MLTLTELAESLDGVWHGNANHAIFSLSSLTRATEKDLAYFDNPLLKHILVSTSAGAVLIKAEYLPLCPVNSIVVADPFVAMNKAMSFLSPLHSKNIGIHPTAQIHPTTQLGRNVAIGAYAVLDKDVQLADGVTIGAHTLIESAVRIGKNTQIGSGVLLHSGSQLGANVLINSGCIVGASPFNYVKQHGIWQQGPDVGGVIISSGVHLGANTVVDRGSLSDTFIGENVCIDNLVQIAHDVFIGNNTAIAGCAAIGSFAHIDADCIIGGASSIAAYVRLTSDVVITGMSTVNKSIATAGIYSSGTLVHEYSRWRRNAARFRRLDDYIVKLGVLEKKVMNNKNNDESYPQ